MERPLNGCQLVRGGPANTTMTELSNPGVS